MSYGQPPSASSGFLRSLKPDFPEEEDDQTMVAGPYGTGASAPTYSTGNLRSSQVQFPVGGQRAVLVDESFHPPPEQAAVRIVQHSSTGNVQRAWDEAGGGGGSLSGVVRKNYSGYEVDDHYSYGEAPGHSGLVHQNQSNNGLSTDNTKSGPPMNARYSMVGKNFRLLNKQLNQPRP